MRFKKTVIAAAIMVTPLSASAVFPVIDAANLAQNIQQQINQVTQLAHEVLALKRQAKMLESVDLNTAGRLASILDRTKGVMNQVRGIAHSSSAAVGQYNQRYPASYEGQSLEQLHQQEAAWIKLNRESQQDVRRVQDQVIHSQSAANRSVQNSLNASQGAAGQKAAIQATNQLLSTLSAQMTQLQNIMAAQGNAVQTAMAKKQNEVARENAVNADIVEGLNHDDPGTGATPSELWPGAY